MRVPLSPACFSADRPWIISHRKLRILSAMPRKGGEAGELLLYPDLPVLGAVHDHTEALSFAKIAVAASPAVAALIEYCKSEALGLLEQNIDIAPALIAALIEKGTLLTDEIDAIISATVVLRSLEKERQRRDDWKARQLNAGPRSMASDVAQCEAVIVSKTGKASRCGMPDVLSVTSDRKFHNNASQPPCRLR
jgi:hypothetical protein